MKTCIVCGKSYTNPGTRCNSCRNKAWKEKNREKDLAQRRAYNSRHWEKIKPIHAERHCQFCEKVFMPNRHTPNQPYCSLKCEHATYRRDNKEKVNRWRRESYRRHKDVKANTDALYKDKIRYSGNRKKCLERDNYSCLNCDSQKDLIVHHNDGTGQTETPNNELDNLQTLCRACHIRIHTHQVTHN